MIQTIDNTFAHYTTRWLKIVGDSNTIGALNTYVVVDRSSSGEEVEALMGINITSRHDPSEELKWAGLARGCES